MLCAIDFEYNKPNETHMGLVCVAWSTGEGDASSMWLHNDQEAKNIFAQYLKDFRDEGYVFICFNASAEARCFVALGIDPTTCKWMDIQVEYKMLTNHCDKLRYGKQLLNGKEVRTTRKDYWGEKLKGKNHSRPEMSLVSCTYKLLGIKEDLVYKNQIRNKIIRTQEFSEELKQEILNYCVKDIKDMFALKDKVFLLHNKSLPVKKFSKGTIVEEVLHRGLSAARSAKMESLGIPVNVQRMTTLARNVPGILDECAKEILELFPDIAPFRWNKKEGRYSKCEKNIKEYILESKYGEKWERTEKGAISLKLEAFTAHFNYRHDFPKDCIFAQMIRYSKINQSFNGLKIKTKDLQDVTEKRKANVFDATGSDGRIKPYLNVYGAQSARYQPKSLTFPFLWSAWIRSVVQAPKGKFICGIDYSSQEFLVSALLAKDKVMIAAYESGDPYMFLGKAAGVIPKDGMRKDYAKERGIFKTVTLGISYGMGAKGLSEGLTTATGEEYTEERADKLIDLFFNIYKDYSNYADQIQVDYQRDRCIKLADGWYLFGDNNNTRSVGNMPIQGMGSCILRKAVELCQEADLKIIFPLHDALYCELETMKEVDLFYDKMKEAFMFYFDDKEAAGLIRQDIDLWGIGLPDKNKVTAKGRDLNCKSIYIDPRSIKEYEKFEKYFTERPIEDANTKEK